LVQTTAQFPVGEHLVYLEIDPANDIEEWSEANNLTSNQFAVFTPPDLTIGAEDLAVLPPVPVANERVTLSIDVHNTGAIAADSVKVAFYDGDPGQGGAALGEPYLLTKMFRESQVHVEKSVFLSAGTHELYIAVDPDGTIAEAIETNNTVVWTLVVGQETDLSFAGQEPLSPLVPVAVS
jgi:subtilase family serine protease